MIAVTCIVELLCFILQIVCLCRIDRKQGEKASCIAFIYLTILSNILLEAFLLFLAYHLYSTVLQNEMTFGTRLMPVLITAVFSIIVGIIEAICMSCMIK